MMKKTIKILLCTLSALIFFYLISMFIYPFTQGNWNDVQAVWDRWQSLNVGMLALVASGIALYASHHYTNRQYKQDTEQRERDYIAARAFLPEALSSLCSYLKNSVTPLKEASNKIYSKEMSTPLKTEIPKQPIDHREVFSKCIALGEPDIGNHLANILTKLQIHNARMRSISDGFGPNKTMTYRQDEMLRYFYITAELYSLTSMMFKEARGLEKFKVTEITIKNMTEAYLNLEIHLEVLTGLAEYTKDRLASRSE